MKKAVATLILLSMVLHFASRSGFITYLHSIRHEIAYCLGLIDEKPIATCDSGYFSETAPLVISDHDERGPQSPAQTFTAKEIILFVEQTLRYEPAFATPSSDWNTITPLGSYNTPYQAIFHPPCGA